VSEFRFITSRRLCVLIKIIITCPPHYSNRDVKELNYNDLRYLENQFHTHEEPLILVRKHAVLVSLNPLRAVVTADKLILVAPSGAESLLYVLHDYMRGIIEDSDTMFRNQGHKSTSELRGYMAMLATITALHQQDYASLATKVESALYNFKSLQNITADMQDTLRVLKNATLSQIIKISSYQRLLTLLFKNEEDLALMNLTLLKDKPYLYRKPLLDEVLNQQDDLSVSFRFSRFRLSIRTLTSDFHTHCHSMAPCRSSLSRISWTTTRSARNSSS
jgi:hypothetical protein